jgi:hypothetical protein
MTTIPEMMDMAKIGMGALGMWFMYSLCKYQLEIQATRLNDVSEALKELVREIRSNGQIAANNHSEIMKEVRK